MAEVQFSQSVVYDFIFAIYPVTILMQLQMSMRRKLGVCANMALGILAGIVGIVKLARLHLVDKGNRLDPTYAETQVSIEVEMEAALLVIAACIPTSGPVLGRLKNFVVSSVTGSSGKSQGPTTYPATISQPKVDRRKAVDDLEYGDAIPMTAYAAWPSKEQEGLPKGHARVESSGTFYDARGGTFFETEADRKSSAEGRRSSDGL
ncbi:MAG: hypothetical protein Q9162_006884 [Coniocarpon cinnabarinum]